MIHAILFDIFGTLTTIDDNDFMRNFLGILAPRFAHLLSPDKFSKLFMRTLAVVQKDPKPGQTNMQTFYEEFSKVTGQTYQSLRPIFEEFYTDDFPTLHCLVQPNPAGLKVVESAMQHGFLTALASNPVLPIMAMKELVSWLGLKPENFSSIPALDNFHFHKPNPGFFIEIAENIGVKPENCLLVTDKLDDNVCSGLGFKVFYSGADKSEFQADYAGPLEDLLHLINQGRL